ncbi:avidin, partial [Columba livia]
MKPGPSRAPTTQPWQPPTSRSWCRPCKEPSSTLVTRDSPPSVSPCIGSLQTPSQPLWANALWTAVERRHWRPHGSCGKKSHPAGTSGKPPGSAPLSSPVSSDGDRDRISLHPAVPPEALCCLSPRPGSLLLPASWLGNTPLCCLGSLQCLPVSRCWEPPSQSLHSLQI